MLGISGASYAVGKSLDNQAGGTKGDNAMGGGGGAPPGGEQSDVEVIAVKKSVTAGAGA